MATPRDAVGLLDAAFGRACDELDGLLDKLTGEGSPEREGRAFADEYRLVIRWGGKSGIEGFEGRLLGVVNETYAREQRQRMLEHAEWVTLERRPVLRGRWRVVEPERGPHDPGPRPEWFDRSERR